eukprot:894898_1
MNDINIFVQPQWMALDAVIVCFFYETTCMKYVPMSLQSVQSIEFAHLCSICKIIESVFVLSQHDTLFSSSIRIPYDALASMPMIAIVNVILTQDFKGRNPPY